MMIVLMLTWNGRCAKVFVCTISMVQALFTAAFVSSYVTYPSSVYQIKTYWLNDYFPLRAMVWDGLEIYVVISTMLSASIYITLSSLLGDLNYYKIDEFVPSAKDFMLQN